MDGNPLPKCPHCGYEDPSYFEYESERTYACDRCGKYFKVTVENNPIFYTEKVA